MNIKHSIHVDAINADGSHNYRFLKLVYTAALRLKLALPLTGALEIQSEGIDSKHGKYKTRTTYEGVISINGEVFNNIVYVIDELPSRTELVTFWRKSQRGDASGSKGGAHPFAEAYLGFLNGKMLEDQTFSPSVVVNEIADIYNSDPKFNITAWIIQKAQSLKTEPPVSNEPLEATTTAALPEEFIPELLLRNKWTTDVLRTGTSYTNYEVDACIKDLCWGKDERIQCQLHWEDGNFILIEDFGRFDRYSDKVGRTRIYDYLMKYSNTSSRARLILTVKGDSTQWTLASSTMLKRLKREIG